MSFDHYTTDDAGRLIEPSADDWRGWVSASRTRNYCLNDTLADWLDLYGAANGFVRDDRLPGYDPELDFAQFLFAQGARFEEAVVRHLETLAAVTRLGGGWEHTRSLDACRETFEAMLGGAEIIHQGVLWNPQTRTYGGADLLIRSDILRRLFPDAIDDIAAAHGAPGIGALRHHYRVVDVKFTGLNLARDGAAGNDHVAYMVQVSIYNEALGRIQEYTPPAAYLLGRGFKQGARAQSESCMERLASVPRDRVIRGEPLASLTRDAVAWVRRVNAEGAAWSPLPAPAVPELRPNMAAQNSWSRACKEIAATTGEVTMAWYVGLKGRDQAAAAGVTDWRDPRFTGALAGLDGVRADTLDRILDINRSGDGEPVGPARVRAAADRWAQPGPVEFYVDFETVSSINDDFSRIPVQNGQERIFMVGCGHVEDGEWRFSCFVADDLSVEAEGRVLDAWFDHLRDVTACLAPGTRPLVFHWSPAETGQFTSYLKSARSRHPGNAWPEPNWFDFLVQVMRAEPVVIRGAMGFGLKAVAKALHSHGLIETTWEDGPADGLGAMVGAWRCEEEAARRGCSMASLEMMRGIRAYNEVDCKTMQETVAFLRTRAILPGKG